MTNKKRIESDTLGSKKIDSKRLWGAQTQRSLENFKIGGEVFGNKIWWNSLRPIHGLLYALFAYFAIIKNKNAWKFLAVDVIIGLVAFFIYHTTNNNLPKLFNFNGL